MDGQNRGGGGPVLRVFEDLWGPKEGTAEGNWRGAGEGTEKNGGGEVWNNSRERAFLAQFWPFLAQKEGEVWNNSTI